MSPLSKFDELSEGMGVAVGKDAKDERCASGWPNLRGVEVFAFKGRLDDLGQPFGAFP